MTPLERLGAAKHSLAPARAAAAGGRRSSSWWAAPASPAHL
jgi:hypothetical protein